MSPMDSTSLPARRIRAMPVVTPERVGHILPWSRIATT